VEYINSKNLGSQLDQWSRVFKSHTYQLSKENHFIPYLLEATSLWYAKRICHMVLVFSICLNCFDDEPCIKRNMISY
jgi:hypothetical protein